MCLYRKVLDGMLLVVGRLDVVGALLGVLKIDGRRETLGAIVVVWGGTVSKYSMGGRRFGPCCCDVSQYLLKENSMW